MSEQYKHVLPEVAPLCGATAKERIRSIYTEKFIAHKAVLEVIRYVLYQVSLPKQTRAWGLIVHGTPGSGKTQLALSVANRLESFKDVTVDKSRMPAVSITMTGARDARIIFNRVLASLQVPISPTMRIADREKLALDLMIRAQVRALLIDEIQDVLFSTQNQQRKALDAVKLIMNEVGVPVVAFGTAKAADAMRADPHLAARFDHKGLPQWIVNNDTCALLAALEKMLPLRKPSHLASPGLVKLIISKSGGTLARIVRLVNMAAVFAIQTGTECISAEMIELASNGVPDAPDLM
jgi:Bacterial TniB protein